MRFNRRTGTLIINTPKWTPKWLLVEYTSDVINIALSMAESLTAEQKRRIEENKRKAIELLALKKGKAKNICGSDPKSLSSSSNVCHSVDQTAGCSNSTKRTERQCELASKPSGELGVVFKKNPPSGTHEKGPEIKKATVPLEKSFTVKLDLTLITSERFKAVCPYDKKLIEIFKGISSKTYGKDLNILCLRTSIII